MGSQETAQIDSVAALAQSFRRSLLASNRAPRTIESYLEAVQLLHSFLSTSGMPVSVGNIKREHIEAFIADSLERFKPATAAKKYRSIQQFFKWLVDEGEIRESPLRNMKPPQVPEVPVPLLSDGELRAVIKSCEGRRFEDRRDMAIIRLFLVPLL